MTYYLPTWMRCGESFYTFHREHVARQYGIFAQVTDAEGVRAITEMIYGSQVTTPDNMALMYQLYAYASDKPALKTVMQIGCGVARIRWRSEFDAQTAARWMRLWG